MLTLLDYRRQVTELYQRVRTLGTDTPQAHALWTTTRDALFGEHPQSALTAEQRDTFAGLAYAPYDPAYRVIATLDTTIEPCTYTLSVGEDGTVQMLQIGRVIFDMPTGQGELGVFWLEGYGGGVFIPFKDTSNGKTTYGGGRYLYDTIKGADLGQIDDALVLDFNYSYHPSCYYNPRWVCPLAPASNRLPFPIPIGEQLLPD
ncbi:MAG: DUF1684 domain-containing protein [Anaerolineae bacterium]